MSDDCRELKTSGILESKDSRSRVSVGFKIPKIAYLKILGLGDLEISKLPRIRESKDSKTQTGGCVRSSGPWIRGFDSLDPGIRETVTESNALPEYPRIRRPSKSHSKAKLKSKILQSESSTEMA